MSGNCWEGALRFVLVLLWSERSGGGNLEGSGVSMGGGREGIARVDGAVWLKGW